MGIDITQAQKVSQLVLSGVRAITAGDLAVNVLTVDLANGTSAPIYELDAGMTLSGLDIQDDGVSLINGTSFADGSRVIVRCPTGTSTLTNEAGVVSAPLRFSIDTAADLSIDARPQELLYSATTSRWIVVSPVVSGDYSASDIVNDSTVVGASVKDALETLDSSVEIVEITPAFILGISPSYTVFKTFPLDEGKSYLLTGRLHFTVGPDTAMLNGGIIIQEALARRSVGGSAQTSSLISNVTGSLGSLRASWQVSGNDVILRLRDNVGSTARITFSYRWEEQGI